VLRCR